MVLLKLKCPPERRKAVIAVSLSTSSPTCQLRTTDESGPPFQIVLTLRVQNSTQADRPITICTQGTVFAPSNGDAGLDTLALGTFSPLISKSVPQKKINLGRLKPHHARMTDPKSPNLRERDWLDFLTIPADGEVQIRHDLPISRMFRYEDSLTSTDLKPGETYRFHINPDYLGTTWWCWGDLEGDLKDKKFSAWQEGINFEKAEKPSPEQVEEEGWILGANPAELAFEDKTGDAEFVFVD
ncbi:MAG: hypothetical protein LQ338_007451 [Usnochroma carphineum]|nr:MAG: hypothetical protein LQ338_007451 [Usnochroma carphineum]